MAKGQTGEGKTTETQAFSFESAQNPSIFPSSVICFANDTFPRGKAIFLTDSQLKAFLEESDPI